jgi:hypothetical protein
MPDISRRNESDEEYERLNDGWKELYDSVFICDKCESQHSRMGENLEGHKCKFNTCDGNLRRLREEDIFGDTR